MKVLLFGFGKLRTPGMREATDYYFRNLQPWVKTEEIELKSRDSLFERIDRLLPTRRRILLLDESGRALNTIAWAKEVREWEASSLAGIALCVGDSHGFSSEERHRADGVLSLGPQTLSHELARLVLAEQLYRAWSVVRGHPYHNP